MSVRYQVLLVARHTIIKQRRPGRSNNTHEDNGRTSKASKKKKRNSQSSDNEYSFEERNVKPEANAVRALNFHGYIYTNQIISSSSKDHNDDSLIMSNEKLYQKDRTRDGEVTSYI